MNLVGRPLYRDRIEPFIDAPVVKVLTGLRRSGKFRLVELVAQRLRDRGSLRSGSSTSTSIH